MEKNQHYNTAIPSDDQVRQVLDQEDRIFVDAMREIENARRRNLDRLAEMIASDPKLRAKLEATQRNKFQPKLDLSSLEEIAARTHTGRVRSDRSNIEHVSPTFRHTSGKTRGVIQRVPFMADNIPRDGHIKVDVAPGKRVLQTDIHLGDAKTEDLSMAMVAAAYGLSGEQLGVIPAVSGGGQSVPDPRLSYIDEAPFVPNHMAQHYLQTAKGPVCPVGPSPSGRALRVEKLQGWSATRRDRAATSAPVRKKLRDRTRAQKQARRKQR
ncbi:hypothetical protein pEaSNUABM20_00038 [Erwinia phage pEa_SNUABM_20]|nr:hypothetical protein pEaSNUABM20_00038 [Erwinia phage pEa_SNUABM_20]